MTSRKPSSVPFPPGENSATAPSALELENTRLRGDLRTLSRRLAHDLRTPLACIETANEGLRDPSALPDSLNALMTRSISNSVHEAATLVERLSLVMLASAHPPALLPVSMSEIVTGTLARLHPRIAEAGAVVTKPATAPTVAGVPAWIELIWTNLIQNSLQHAGPQPRIALGWETLGHAHRFWIRDSGPGVTAGRRERLFHPFERLHETNAPHGYGLSIVRRLVELLGGQCGYEPAPTAGGSFFFTLRTAVQ